MCTAAYLKSIHTKDIFEFVCCFSALSSLYLYHLSLQVEQVVEPTKYMVGVKNDATKLEIEQLQLRTHGNSVWI